MTSRTQQPPLQPTPVSVIFEHHEPMRIGIGEARPRLSWQIAAAPAEYTQTAYRLETTIESPTGARETRVSEIGGADGGHQVLVPWPARTLISRERAIVRVQVASAGVWGPWSEPAVAEVGLLEANDWSAHFVGADWEEDRDTERRPARVRTEFTLPANVVRARLYLTAHGLAEAEINGHRVGNEALTPGWTSYSHRLRYAAFDVTEQVVSGNNAIGIWLGDGWYRGRIGFEGGKRNVYGDDLSACAQLEVVTKDGTVHTIITDADWSAAFGPILLTGLYDGERFDARLDDAAWSQPGYRGDQAGLAAAGWKPVRVAATSPLLMVAPTGPPVRCTEELLPVSVINKGDGRFLLDFGQNHSGRLRIRAHGAAGNTITLRHAEVLQDGELYTRTLRDAAATDELILDGGHIEWEPRFTIHGYRYAEVSGWADELAPGDVVSRVYHTDMRRTGWFRSSDPRVNRLHNNALWSLRSNFVDIPTDCPQRDERLGWTGDIQVFTPTAAFLYDVTGMLDSWLRDLALEQTDLGTVPLYVPYLPLGAWGDMPADPVAIWGDVAVLAPDVLHQRTGDVELVRRQYPSAVGWMSQVEATAGADRICDKTMQLGDWLDPAAPPENPFEATTAPDLVATAYFAHSARRMSALAALIGESADAVKYTTLADDVSAAYAARYLLPSGRATSDSQTAYSLTEMFDLYPNDAARFAGNSRLALLVREANARVATGFAGTPVVSDALTRGGHLEEAYRLLLGEECPSWLYTVKMGATTIWERWDSMLADGTVNPGDMTSFNHYALGAVADWLHRVVAGIAPAAPGYRRIRFAPRPGGTLTSAGATHLTPYGEAAIDWTVTAAVLRVAMTVPVGCTAEVDLPGIPPFDIGHGHKEYEVADGALRTLRPMPDV